MPISRRMNVKANTLKNVSASERLYSPVNSTEAACAIAQYGRGFIAYFGDVNNEDETIQLIFEILQNARRKAIVLRKPIAEFSVPELPLKVLQAAGIDALCGLFILRESILSCVNGSIYHSHQWSLVCLINFSWSQAWCDGWCLEARQRGKPQYGGIGFYFDEDSGYGSYHGPIEDNAHPVRTQ